MKVAILPPRPEGHEYYGPLEPATVTDGWCYGHITAAPCSLHPQGCESGDGYAVAPDGSYAGLVWWTECPWEIEPVEREGSEQKTCFGVFDVRFNHAVASVDDLVNNFREVLPLLKESTLSGAQRKNSDEAVL
jgi:hypothetical protein